MNKKIFILAENDDKLNKIKNNVYFHKVNLSKLEVQHQINLLAENRIYFSDLVEEKMDFIGFASYRWNEKYKNKLEDQCRVDIGENQILVADKVDKNWADRSESLHPGMGRLLIEMSEISGLNLKCGETFYSNNYICSKKIFDDFLIYWKFVFNYFYIKYGYNLPFSNSWKSNQYKPQLHQAYFYERITMLYFANKKLDFIIAK